MANNEALDYLKTGQLPPVRVKLDEKNLVQITAVLVITFVVCLGIWAIYKKA